MAVPMQQENQVERTNAGRVRPWPNWWRSRHGPPARFTVGQSVKKRFSVARFRLVRGVVSRAGRRFGSERFARVCGRFGGEKEKEIHCDGSGRGKPWLHFGCKGVGG